MTLQRCAVVALHSERVASGSCMGDGMVRVAVESFASSSRDGSNAVDVPWQQRRQAGLTLTMRGTS
jgi:hypothetical protein